MNHKYRNTLGLENHLIRPFGHGFKSIVANRFGNQVKSTPGLAAIPFPDVSFSDAFRADFGFRFLSQLHLLESFVGSVLGVCE